MISFFDEKTSKTSKADLYDKNQNTCWELGE